MIKYFKKIFTIDTSQEKTANILIWIYGPTGYLISYFVINNLMMTLKAVAANIILLAIIITYLSWHIYQLRKCSIIKRELLKKSQTTINTPHHSLTKSFLRKLFLQESLTKSDPIFVAILIDLFFIVNSIDYFLVSINYL
jgi:hypothetical protein